MIYKTRPILLVLIVSILTSLSVNSQKPTVYYTIKKLHETENFYVGYRTKVTITNSKKKGIDTSYYRENQGLFATSDKDGLTPLLKFDRANFKFKTDNEKDHFIHLKTKNKIGVLNLVTGKLVIPTEFDHIDYNGKDKVFICKSKSGGYLYNTKGEKVSTIPYKNITSCSNGYFDKEQSGSNAKIYNLQNEVVIDFGLVKIIEEIFYDSIYLIEKNRKYGIVNSKNEILLPFDYDYIEWSEGEYSEFYSVTKIINSVPLKTIIKPQENGSWKEVLPINFTYITEIEMYNNAATLSENKIFEAVYYGVNAQNKGIFMDKTGTILFALEDGPKIYQASILEERFLEVSINYSDYSMLYALENGKQLLDEGHYFQHRLPAPFDNFLLFITEGKEYGSCLLNVVNYSLTTFTDYLYDFELMKPELQAIFSYGEMASHLILFNLEKNVVRKCYSSKNYFELDLMWWEQYNYVVAQENYSKKGHLFVYDLENDSLIYNEIQTETAYITTLNSLSTQMTHELKSITPLNEQLVNLPNLNTTKNADSTYSVFINNDSLIIPYLSKKLLFEWLDFSNAYCIGTTLMLNSTKFDINYSQTAVFDDRLNMIMPYKEGYVINIIPTTSGEIIALLYNEDSVNYYHTSTGKTLYFNTINKTLNIKKKSIYLFDWIPFANHVIIYEKDFNYIMDYNGKVLYKSKEIDYVNIGNNYLLEPLNENSKILLIPSMVTAQVGEGLIQEYSVYPYVFVKNGQEFYGLYDAQTGKTVLNHEIKSFATFLINESIWIENKEGKFAIYNLKTNSIGNGYIYESEEAALMEIENK